MTIRDDRKMNSFDGWYRGWLIPATPAMPTTTRNLSPDAVLYDCPDCGRAHFVTVDPCPDAATAAKEVAMVDQPKRAA